MVFDQNKIYEKEQLQGLHKNVWAGENREEAAPQDLCFLIVCLFNVYLL